MVWVWIGDLEPVPIEEDLPMAMKIPGVFSLIHFTKVWNTNWSLLFDNFIDGLHAPYLHRLSPQFLLRKLAFRALDGRPHFQFVEHDGKVLECAHTRGAQRPQGRQGLVYEMEYPGLGTFPEKQWWRIRGPKMRPQENFLPGIPRAPSCTGCRRTYTLSIKISTLLNSSYPSIAIIFTTCAR